MFNVSRSIGETWDVSVECIRPFTFSFRDGSASTTELDNVMCFAQMNDENDTVYNDTASIKVRDEKCEENTCHDIDERIPYRMFYSEIVLV